MRISFLKILAAAHLALAAMAGAALAFPADPDRTWRHKDWSAAQYGRVCVLWTGGDGHGSFRVRIEEGGYNADIVYEPIWARGYHEPVGFEDEFSVYIDGRETDYGPEMAVYDGEDEWGEYFRRVGMTTGFTPAMIFEMRRGGRLAMQVDKPGQAPAVYDDFSLSGFTASFLKVSEWRRFHPDRLFQS